MPIVYRIRDWAKLFETNETRKLKALRYVTVPNKMDGDGYTQLVDHPEGPLHYAAWMAILLVASKCAPRGTLLRGNGQPYDAASLARVTRMPETMFSAAISRLSVEIGWLETVDLLDVTTETSASAAEASQSFREDVPERRDDPPERRDHSLSERPERTEPKGRTGNITGAGKGGGDFEKRNGREAVRLRVLDKMHADHLAHEPALEALWQELRKEPGLLLPGEDGFLQIIGASVRALAIGKRPISLFVRLVRDQRWDLISEAQRATARERLLAFKDWKAKKTK